MNQQTKQSFSSLIQTPFSRCCSCNRKDLCLVFLLIITGLSFETLFRLYLTLDYPSYVINVKRITFAAKTKNEMESVEILPCCSVDSIGCEWAMNKLTRMYIPDCEKENLVS